MFLINLAVILIYIMLAILSRKHYSKYKAVCDCETSQNKHRISEMICDGVLKINSLRKMQQKLRKVKVESEDSIRRLFRKCVIGCIAKGLAIVFVFNLISFAFELYERINAAEGENIIEREGYEGNTKTHDIYLDNGNDVTVYSLMVEPIEYTEEQFLSKAEKILDSLTTVMLGKNEDAEHILYDLELPVKDETGLFIIEWSSSQPGIITSFGRVDCSELEQEAAVTLTATVEYMNYKISRQYPLLVRTHVGNAEMSELERIGSLLNLIEMENRNSKEFTIPKEISDVKISLSEKDDNMSVKIFVVGIIICFMPVIIAASRLNEAEKRRNNMLVDCYASFVNRIWLLLGTGMTIKACIKKLVLDYSENSVLRDELAYTIRQIDTGIDEAYAYEQLGQRLLLPQYLRIMNHISQNLQLGTKSLAMLMEDEVHIALQTKKERAISKGEEASTKLLLPMIILLAVVMVIVIAPAVIQF